jgi:polyvinyl alcohol dehydrogenase (cytochrome)
MAAAAILAVAGAGLVLLVSVRRHPDGAKVFTRYCAPCHQQGVNKGGRTGAPDLDTLRRMTRQDILRNLQTGVMKPEGSRLSPAQQIAVAEYLGTSQATVAQSLDGACRGDPDPPPAETRWDGWGVNASNTRFQSPAAAGLTSAQVPSLRLKWAFGFPGAWATYGQPTAFGGKILKGVRMARSMPLMR